MSQVHNGRVLNQSTLPPPPPPRISSHLRSYSASASNLQMRMVGVAWSFMFYAGSEHEHRDITALWAFDYTRNAGGFDAPPVILAEEGSYNEMYYYSQP